MYNPENAEDRKELAFKLINTLQQKNFIEEPSFGERVFSFSVSPQKKVLIYTSVVHGEVRNLAKDAIHITGVYIAKDGKQRGLVKNTRVYRTGQISDIVKRTLERARKTFLQLKTVENCKRCGSPMFLSKKDNLCCAELCFLGDKR